MSILRMHWFDLGLALAALAAGLVIAVHPIGIALLLWLNLIALFLHQAEEYRYPGYFPGMMNAVMFSSPNPDRYPLNPQTALIINTLVGWLVYLLAALFGLRAPWLGMAAVLISAGNFIAHTFLFNIKGKTAYNPGMATGILFFLPLTVLYFTLLVGSGAASPVDWIAGILLGLALNAIGILKMIDWLKDEHTPYTFPARFLIPVKARAKSSRIAG